MELNHWGPLVSPLVTTKKSHVERPKRILPCVTVHKTGLENVQETALKQVLPWFYHGLPWFAVQKYGQYMPVLIQSTTDLFLSFQV